MGVYCSPRCTPISISFVHVHQQLSRKAVEDHPLSPLPRHEPLSDYQGFLGFWPPVALQPSYPGSYRNKELISAVGRNLKIICSTLSCYR